MGFIFLTLGYHPDLTGGAYRLVQSVAERLAARGHRVEVIFPAAQPGLPPSELRRGVTLYRFPNTSGFFVRNWRQENSAARVLLRARTAAAGAPTLTVLCHAFLGPAAASSVPRQVFLFTGPWAEEYRYSRQTAGRSIWRRCWEGLVAAGLRTTERRALRQASRILTISRYYAEQLPIWHGGGLPPVSVISCGVDGEEFRPDENRMATRKRWGLAADEFLFLTVRRLDPRMGLLGLIEAFATVSPGFLNARLWLAGRGPQQAELASRIAALGLAERVRLLGFVPENDLPGILCAADCAVMPSLDLEGFGLATLEALACGAPVLGSRSGATPELLAPLSDDLLFEAGSERALADRLRAVLSNPACLPSREACRNYATKHYSWERPVLALEQCGKELEAEGGGG